jgi:hypothetical protein
LRAAEIARRQRGARLDPAGEAELLHLPRKNESDAP